MLWLQPCLVATVLFAISFYIVIMSQTRFRFQTFDDIRSKPLTARSLDPRNPYIVHQTKHTISQPKFQSKQKRLCTLFVRTRLRIVDRQWLFQCCALSEESLYLLGKFIQSRMGEEINKEGTGLLRFYIWNRLDLSCPLNSRM